MDPRVVSGISGCLSFVQSCDSQNAGRGGIRNKLTTNIANYIVALDKAGDKDRVSVAEEDIKDPRTDENDISDESTESD
jgi:hypothetical protein